MITNYLSPTGFVVAVQRLPNVEFFTQNFTIPGLSMASVVRDTPLMAIYDVPDRIDYGTLDLSFIIDENCDNYLEIVNWMEGIAPPFDKSGYETLVKDGAGTKSDISVVIQSSHKNPNLRCTFYDCFPISLDPISFDLTASDIDYPTAGVTFQHSHFKLEKL